MLYNPSFQQNIYIDPLSPEPTTPTRDTTTIEGDSKTMKITAECIPCLLYRALYETRLVDEKKAWEVMRTTIGILEAELPKSDDLEKRPVSAEIATILHKKTYEILEDHDPYKDMKKRSNAVARSLLPTAEEFIKNAEDPFETAVICSIVGNLLDFGIRSSAYTPEKLAKNFNSLTLEGLHINHSKKLKELLKERGEVLYFTDNCGEVVFDTLLMKEIKALGVDISLVVKGEPILTDATMDDVLELGLDKLVDRVYTTESYAVGVNFKALPEGISSRMKRNVPILAKGMANYESFSGRHYQPICYLMRTKCDPVAESLGFEKDMNVVVLFE